MDIHFEFFGEKIFDGPVRYLREEKPTKFEEKDR